MMKLKNTVHSTLRSWASRYLNSQYNPTYKELGVLVCKALTVAIPRLGEDAPSSPSESRSLGYLKGYYGTTFDRLTYDYSMSDEVRNLAGKCSLVLYACDRWCNSMLNPHELEFNESWIRDLSAEITQLAAV